MLALHLGREAVGERLRGRLNQSVRILRMPASVRLAKAMGRAGDFGNRLVSRMRRQSSAPPTTLERCEAAYRVYRPRAYAGRVVLFGPDRSLELGIDLAEFWRRFAGALDVIRVPGGHHELVRSSQHTKGLARALNDALRGLPTIEPAAASKPTAKSAGADAVEVARGAAPVPAPAHRLGRRPRRSA